MIYRVFARGEQPSFRDLCGYAEFQTALTLAWKTLQQNPDAVRAAVQTGIVSSQCEQENT